MMKRFQPGIRTLFQRNAKTFLLVCLAALFVLNAVRLEWIYQVFKRASAEDTQQYGYDLIALERGMQKMQLKWEFKKASAIWDANPEYFKSMREALKDLEIGESFRDGVTLDPAKSEDLQILEALSDSIDWNRNLDLDGLAKPLTLKGISKYNYYDNETIIGFIVYDDDVLHGKIRIVYYPLDFEDKGSAWANFACAVLEPGWYLCGEQEGDFDLHSAWEYRYGSGEHYEEGSFQTSYEVFEP